jgi:pimeloyl-ACP methyl ester carboxylesterase
MRRVALLAIAGSVALGCAGSERDETENRARSVSSADSLNAAAGLPNPTGPFSVGKVTLHVIDSARTGANPVGRGPRELMLDIWYPAAPGAGATVPYVDVAAFDAGFNGFLQNELGAGYDALKGKTLQTHAHENAPFASDLKRAPLLFFSHGGGMVSQFYTVQLEELASHGYVVAAINHPYDAGLTVFPDGRRIIVDTAGWNAAKTEADRTEKSRRRIEVAAADIRFALNALGRLDRTSKGQPFAGRVDFSRVGAFGHSMGGEAAARACQLDPRFRACSNQDGAIGWAPFELDASGWGMDQAFLLIERLPKGFPSDAELAAMHMTRKQAEDTMRRLRARQDTILMRVGKGSYQVWLVADSTRHASFSDELLLQAKNEADRDLRSRALKIVNEYTLAFFDRFLRERQEKVLDATPKNGLIEGVRRFPPGIRPRS